MRERRVGEGEREEMRGDFRRGGRHSACAGTLNKSGLPQPARPPASLRAGMRHTGASRIEGWARWWELLLTGGNAQSRGQAIG